ncbi:DUF523 domain-containing protein [Dethiobacter alkaliphilus]|uniref:Uncharacterized protein n=1 Tax=Dethiobacter alkaliphilus AHT 1 TaxID=555088 RepID=C0GJ97_DETAL|nr:DUF523 domain-containing protein [Dethiobacter alkaliphilus]EEG76582.1 protein of unknown function DUF523 [Dethiobacter alkaliphilus AHT 1]
MKHDKEWILVSACLLGVNAKYNAGNNRNAAVLALSGELNLLPVCPEQLGGLPTPRPAAEISGGAGEQVLQGRARVCTAAGQDRSEAFLRGARETLSLAELYGVRAAIFKARSPSCGCGRVYDGSFAGTLQPGDGVTTALLKQKGISVFTEEEVFRLQEWKQIKDS